MNNLLAMGKALFNHLDTNSSMDVYYQKAKQSVKPPFCVITFISATDDYTFNSSGMNADYMIKVVSDKLFPDTAIEDYGAIHTLLQDASIAVENSVLLRIRRESLIQFQDPQDFWNVGGIYNLDIWKI